MSKELKVFVDSDVFVALLKEKDNTHEKAKKLLLKLLSEETVFVTSNYVISESITVISQKIDHKTAIKYVDEIYSSKSPYRVMRVSGDIEELAIEIFKKQTSKNTSFVDCVNMAFMRQNNVDAIFSFDQIYRKNGFKLLEDLFK